MSEEKRKKMAPDLGPEQPDFTDGYRDGLDTNCPEPSENRSLKYKYSFCVGRAEILEIKLSDYKTILEAAYKADEMEKKRT